MLILLRKKFLKPTLPDMYFLLLTEPLTHTIIFSNIVYFFAHSSQGEHLLKATTPEQIKRVLMTEARTLSSKRLSALSERLFMGEMRNELGIRVTDTNAVANDLFEAVEAEEKRWNEGVAGLDDAMVSVKCCFFYCFFWNLCSLP